MGVIGQGIPSSITSSINLYITNTIIVYVEARWNIGRRRYQSSAKQSGSTFVLMTMAMGEIRP